MNDGSSNRNARSDYSWRIPDYVYLSRWFPIRASPSPIGDIILARLGAILIGCLAIAALIRRGWF